MSGTAPPCVVCATPSTLRCAFCSSGPLFCSNAHFLEHWPRHKDACMRASAAAAYQGLRPEGVPRPTLDRVIQVFNYMVIAYILEAGAARPRFTSVDCSTGLLNDEQPHVVPRLAKYFPNGRGCHILHYDQNMTVLTKAYHIYYSIPSYTGLTDPNDAIHSLVYDTPGYTGARWPGTVVVFKFADRMCTTYENMHEVDVANIKIHFALFGRRRG